MAGRRRDPYRNFNFRNMFGALALTGLAGAIAARLFGGFKRGKGAAEETPAGARPIEPVGTSTAGSGTKPTGAKRSPVRPRRASKQRKPTASRRKRV